MSKMKAYIIQLGELVNPGFQLGSEPLVLYPIENQEFFICSETRLKDRKKDKDCGMNEKNLIVDFHTHLFPPEIRENRETYFDGEPAFKLLYASPKSKMIGAGKLAQAMDEQGVDISVVFGFPWKNLETAKRHNDYIAEAVARYPHRFKGFCCLDPCPPEAVSEVERCLRNGLCGVGELAFYRSGIECVIVDSMEPVMALCREQGVPVLIHTNEPVGHRYPGKTENTLLQIYDLVK